MRKFRVCIVICHMERESTPTHSNIKTKYEVFAPPPLWVPSKNNKLKQQRHREKTSNSFSPPHISQSTFHLFSSFQQCHLSLSSVHWQSKTPKLTHTHSVCDPSLTLYWGEEHTFKNLGWLVNIIQVCVISTVRRVRNKSTSQLDWMPHCTFSLSVDFKLLLLFWSIHYNNY